MIIYLAIAYLPIQPLVNIQYIHSWMYFLKFSPLHCPFSNSSILKIPKKNTSTCGCIKKYTIACINTYYLNKRDHKLESQHVLKIHGSLRRYCTFHVLLRSTLQVQHLLNLPCILNTSLDSIVYLHR